MKMLMLSKRYKSTGVDRRTLASETLWSTSSQTPCCILLSFPKDFLNVSNNPDSYMDLYLTLLNCFMLCCSDYERRPDHW